MVPEGERRETHTHRRERQRAKERKKERNSERAKRETGETKESKTLVTGGGRGEV